MWVWICHRYLAHSLSFGGSGLFVVPDFKATFSHYMTLCTTSLTFVPSWHCVDLSGNPSQVVIWLCQNKASQLFSSSVHLCVWERKRSTENTTFTTVTFVLLSYCCSLKQTKMAFVKFLLCGFLIQTLWFFFYIIVFTVLEINELKRDCKVPDSNVSTICHFYLKTFVLCWWALGELG